MSNNRKTHRDGVPAPFLATTKPGFLPPFGKSRECVAHHKSQALAMITRAWLITRAWQAHLRALTTRLSAARKVRTSKGVRSATPCQQMLTWSLRRPPPVRMLRSTRALRTPVSACTPRQARRARKFSLPPTLRPFRRLHHTPCRQPPGVWAVPRGASHHFHLS